MKLAGFDTGLKIGQAINATLFGNQGMVVVHRIPGRRRYICKALQGVQSTCEDLEALLRRFPGISYARVNPLLGSVTVEYTLRERAINELFDALSHQIAGQHALQESTILPAGVLAAGDNVFDTFRRLKMGVTRFFNHAEPAFLTRLAGIALLMYGFNRVFLSGERPSGPQILLWGLALLLRPSHPDPKGLEEDLQQALLGNKNAEGGRG